MSDYNVPSTSKSEPRHSMQSLHYIVRSGVAGGIAGCVAKSVVAPLDRVKILFQASNPDYNKYAGSWSGAFRAGSQIYRDNGLLGLFQGHSATLLRIFPYAAIKFMAYDQIEHVHFYPETDYQLFMPFQALTTPQILMPTTEQQTNARRFTAGALSGMTSVLFTYPLELIRVRMAYHTRSSTCPSSTSSRPKFLEVVSKIYNEHAPPTSSSSPSSSTIAPTKTTKILSPSTLFSRFPILKFYRGFTVTITGMIPYAGTSFLTWGFLRSHLLAPPPSPSSSSSPSSSATSSSLSLPLQKPKPSPVSDLLIGALSGAIAQTVSYPFEVIRRRMQVGGLTHPDRWLGWRETVSGIWTGSSGSSSAAVAGWRGFYVGLSIGYLKVVPMTAVSFMVWQWGKRILGV